MSQFLQTGCLLVLNVVGHIGLIRELIVHNTKLIKL